MFSLLQQSAVARRLPGRSARAALAARAMPDGSGLAGLFPYGGLACVRHLDPFLVGRGAGDITVVPVPPFVRPGLGVTLRRVLPLLLTPERRDVEVAPGAAHRLVAAAVDEVGAEHLVTVAEEHVVAVPFIDAEVLVEAIGHGVPRDLPAHSRLHTRDVRLRRA